MINDNVEVSSVNNELRNVQRQSHLQQHHQQVPLILGGVHADCERMEEQQLKRLKSTVLSLNACDSNETGKSAVIHMNDTGFSYCHCIRIDTKVERIGNVRVITTSIPFNYQNVQFVVGPHWLGPIIVTSLLFTASYHTIRSTLFERDMPWTGTTCIAFTIVVLYNLILTAYTDPGIAPLKVQRRVYSCNNNNSNHENNNQCTEKRECSNTAGTFTQSSSTDDDNDIEMNQMDNFIETNSSDTTTLSSAYCDNQAQHQQQQQFQQEQRNEHVTRSAPVHSHTSENAQSSESNLDRDHGFIEPFTPNREYENYVNHIYDDSGGDINRNMLRWCDICNCYKLPTAIHCHFCNVCIEKYDHHCIWIGQCIGGKNMKYFVRFNLSWILYLIFAIFQVSTKIKGSSSN